MTTTILVRNRAKDPDYTCVTNGPGPGLSFLCQSLLPVLRALGDVKEVAAGTDLHGLCRSLRDEGNEPVYCVFGLPAEADIPDCCPVIAAIAWPFDVLPIDSAERWRERLRHCAGVVTFCQQSAGALRRLMGERFPVMVSPAQPWERFAGICPAEGALPLLHPRIIHFTGQLLDSPSIGLSVDALARPEPAPESVTLLAAEPVIEDVAVQVQLEAEPLTWRQRLYITGALLRGWWREVTGADRHLRQRMETVAAVSEAEPEPVAIAVVPSPCLTAEAQRFTLHGVVYTCVLRAEDETRNWTEMLTAFCRTFGDQPDATLVFKFTHENLSSGRIGMLTNLSRLAPFKCRVVIINGHLDEQEYAHLIAASHFLVHPALSESSAITVQEFMSAGRPIIAPRHSALSDWLEEDHPLTIQCSRQSTHWAGDPDKRMRYFDHRLNWQSMCAVFQDSFNLAMRAAGDYQAMSVHARTQVRNRASMTQLQEQWRGFLTRIDSDVQATRVLAEALRAGA
ncbi:glycosyltransferase [Pseudomonas nitroreducens]|uniref:glycosyltransferase n=1 Tax=Pseudomonas nitroreducens TaxID=46680 RepID=UPI0038219968